MGVETMMNHSNQIAENATMQSFINCYLRETGNYHNTDTTDQGEPLYSFTGPYEKVIHCPLPNQQTNVIVPIKYWSSTGRHLLRFPLYYQTRENAEPNPIDYVTLTSLIIKELLLDQDDNGSEDELMLRVILSCRNMKKYIAERLDEAGSLAKPDFEYIDAEQSLLFGHLLHPTPKSKQGISEKEDDRYSPEMKGEFQLHYFIAHKSIVLQESNLDVSANEIILEELKSDPDVDQAFLKQFETKKEQFLIPVHPLQAKRVLEKSHVRDLLLQGFLEYIGPLGPLFTATSSFRTVYSKNAKYMFKFSVPVKITNSLRVNQQKELNRGVEISRLMDTRIGKELDECFPRFRIIKDPAYLNLNFNGEETGLDVVIRENPFYENCNNATLIAGLCQDNPYGKQPRIHVIMNEIAKRERKPIERVSLEWFDRYLSLTLNPMLWLYHTYGIALEAHQQNSIVQLKDGFPDRFYYRDNQGYYFSESKANKLEGVFPKLNQDSDTICSDEVAEERLRYYFFFNHLFGLINGFGASGLITEKRLIQQLRDRLHHHEEQLKEESNLLRSLLYQAELPCKANLLTRFHDMDELAGSLETQSVYTMVKNPIFQEVGVTDEA